MTIEQFRDEHEFLSNFYAAPIRVDGKVYPTSEHLFAASKTTDVGWQEEIRESRLPGEAKQLGRQAPLRPDWEEIKYSVMESVLSAKFGQNPDLAQQLKDTEPHHLIEGNFHHDQVWGDCLCIDHRDTPGRNALGILLMRVRLEL